MFLVDGGMRWKTHLQPILFKRHSWSLYLLFCNTGTFPLPLSSPPLPLQNSEVFMAQLWRWMKSWQTAAKEADMLIPQFWHLAEPPQFSP